MYSDYKAVDGILFAHKKATKIMGQDVEVITKSLKLNNDIAPGTFK
jgi:hypothetical protein